MGLQSLLTSHPDQLVTLWFSERSCVQKIRWRVIEEDASTSRISCIIHMYPHINILHIYTQKQEAPEWYHFAKLIKCIDNIGTCVFNYLSVSWEWRMHHAYGGQRTTYGSNFSPTMWVLVMELRLSDLATRRLDLLIYLTGPKIVVVLLSICMWVNKCYTVLCPVFHLYIHLYSETAEQRSWSVAWW